MSSKKKTFVPGQDVEASGCDESLTGAASAYHGEMRAALHELSTLRGRCLCRGSFRCIDCLEQMEADGIGDEVVTLSMALGANVDRVAILESALAESVKIQSHYATLLNMRDGGARTVFASSEEWIARIEDLERPRSRR